MQPRCPHDHLAAWAAHTRHTPRTTQPNILDARNPMLAQCTKETIVSTDQLTGTTAGPDADSPDDAAPTLAPFHVDAAAFDAWFELKADTIEFELPATAQPTPAALFGGLIEEAAAMGPIAGDSRVEILLIVADDPPGPGYVLVVRPRGHLSRPGLTIGWTPLTYPLPDDEPRDAVWRYLVTICDQANLLLDAALLQCR